MLSEIIFLNRNGLRWRDAPLACGSPKTLYNCWVRWRRANVFARMLIELADVGALTYVVMIYSVHRKALRMAASQGRKVAAASASSVEAWAA